MKPSKYQQGVFDWVETSTGNAVVEAVAGSGKTTTIVAALSKIPANKRVLFLAFNTEIVKELQSRVPSHVEARTFNSLGHRAVMQAHKGVVVQSNKIYKKFQEVVGAGYTSSMYKCVKAVVEMARQLGFAPEGYASLIPQTEESWDAIFTAASSKMMTQEGEASMRAMKPRILDYSKKTLLKMLEDRKQIDFGDQLYLPLVLNLEMPQYDFVFVDEAQDLNSIQHVMLKRIMRPGARMCAVGDRFQSIYAFRGADSRSMDRIKKEFNAVELPLSITYRCPKKVVKLAQHFVPHLEAAEWAGDGEVSSASVDFAAGNFEKGDMVLCRNNAPLVKAAYKFIMHGVSCKIKGKDIGKNLCDLIDKMKVQDLRQLVDKLQSWADRQIAVAQAEDPDADVDAIQDKVDAVMTFIKCGSAKDANSLKLEIDSFFVDDPQGVVVLSTIHKAKGLEADRVFIINPNLIGRQRKKPYTAEELQQEKNLFYVAVTRAKKSLQFVRMPEEKPSVSMIMNF